LTKLEIMNLTSKLRLFIIVIIYVEKSTELQNKSLNNDSDVIIKCIEEGLNIFYESMSRIIY